MINELCKGVITERDTLNNHLDNLLAVIHRDGGHYQGEHGIDKSVADAMLIVSNMIADLYAEKSLRHSRESALESLTQTYVDVVEQRSKLEAEVTRLNQIIGVYGRSDRTRTEYIQRLEDALGEYADAGNWDDRGGWINCFFSGPGEGPDIARAALADSAKNNPVISELRENITESEIIGAKDDLFGGDA